MDNTNKQKGKTKPAAIATQLMHSDSTSSRINKTSTIFISKAPLLSAV